MINYNYLFLCKECCYFCLASSQNSDVLQTFDYFYNWLTKFPVIKLMREPYDFIHHLQSVWSGLDSFRIFNLFIYVFIAWYIHNLVSWVFSDFFSNFPTPENAACIFCWHRGSNIPVKIHVVTNSTSPASSFTKLANSSSVSWSSVCTSPSWTLLRKSHLGKQLMTIWPETSSHAALIQEITFNTSTSWIISEPFLLSSIRISKVSSDI